MAQFLKDILEGVGPSVALGRDSTMLKEILDKTAERVGKDLKDQPEVEAELRSTIGTTYCELGEWQRHQHRGALRSWAAPACKESFSRVMLRALIRLCSMVTTMSPSIICRAPRAGARRLPGSRPACGIR